MQKDAISDVTKLWVTLLHLPRSPSGSHRISPHSQLNHQPTFSALNLSLPDHRPKPMLNVVSRNIAHPVLAGYPVARSLASRAGLRSTTRSLSTTPVVHNSSQGPFSFLPANKLEKKIGRGERSKGLTEISRVRCGAVYPQRRRWRRTTEANPGPGRTFTLLGTPEGRTITR